MNTFYSVLRHTVNIQHSLNQLLQKSHKHYFCYSVKTCEGEWEDTQQMSPAGIKENTACQPNYWRSNVTRLC